MTNNGLRQNAEEPQAITRLGLSLLVILLGSYLAPLLMHSSTLAIPAMATDLSLSAEVVSGFTLVQMLANACLVLPAGKLADRFGRKRFFCIGLLIAGIACFIGGTAQGGTAIVLSRALQGVGTAFVFAASVALVMSVPPEESKARVMGVYISIAYLGIVTGPLVGGVVLKYLDWRWVFFLPGAGLLVLGLIGLWFLHWERFGDRESRLRFADNALYMGALVLLALGVYNTANAGGGALLLSGVVLFVVFFWFQTRRRDPLLQVGLFLHNRTFGFLAVAHLLTYSSILALPFTLTLYLQYIKGIDPQSTGYILLTQALCTAVIAPVSGWLTGKMRPRWLIFGGIVILCAASFILTLLTELSSAYLALAALVMVGISIGLMDTPLLHTAMKTVNEQMLGAASATMNGMRILGGFVGIGLISSLMHRHLGEREIVPALYSKLMLALQQFYMLAAVFAFLALFLLLYGVLTRRRNKWATEQR